MNLRSGSNEDYIIDANTNRYFSVGGNSLSYDEARNLTTDKDGYNYYYDYENRIVKITKSGQTKAEFAYDALGRRVEKKDLIDSSNTRRYYYNNNWQVLCEYDGSNTFKKLYVYGNYIDEVLLMYDDLQQGSYLYAHDHLYSPAALVDLDTGNVLERYEYDAYGDCNILYSDFTRDADQKSDYENPYYFTGRTMDVLDNGNLKIMDYRHRCYDTYTGRFLQHDPLGVNPAGDMYNPFAITDQYTNGMSLYEYASNKPLTFTDPYGKLPWWISKCVDYITPGPGPIEQFKSNNKCYTWVNKGQPLEYTYVECENDIEGESCDSNDYNTTRYICTNIVSKKCLISTGRNERLLELKKIGTKTFKMYACKNKRWKTTYKLTNNGVTIWEKIQVQVRRACYRSRCPYPNMG